MRRCANPWTRVRKDRVTGSRLRACLHVFGVISTCAVGSKLRGERFVTHVNTDPPCRHIGPPPCPRRRPWLVTWRTRVQLLRTMTSITVLGLTTVAHHVIGSIHSLASIHRSQAGGPRATGGARIQHVLGGDGLEVREAEAQFVKALGPGRGGKRRRSPHLAPPRAAERTVPGRARWYGQYGNTMSCYTLRDRR